MVWRPILFYNVVRYQISADYEDIFSDFIGKLWNTLLPQLIEVGGYLFWKFFPLADGSLITSSMIKYIAIIIMLLGITKYSRG